MTKAMWIDGETFASDLNNLLWWLVEVVVDLGWLLSKFDRIKRLTRKEVLEAYGPSTQWIIGYSLNCDDLLTMLVHLNPSEVHPVYDFSLIRFTNVVGCHLLKLFDQHDCRTQPLQGDEWYKNPHNRDGIGMEADRVLIINMIRRLASAKESAQQTATILLGLQKRGNPLFGLIGRDVTKYISRVVKDSYWAQIKTELLKEYNTGRQLYLETKECGC